MSRYSPHRNQSAFSLLEMILVLTIITLILVGAFLLYPRVRDAAQSKEEATIVKSIIGEVRLLYPNGNYGPLLSSDLVGGNALVPDFYMAPTDTVNSPAGAVLSNRWGAAIEVYPSQADGTPIIASPTTNSAFFAVRYWGATPGLCRSMVSQLLSSMNAVLVDDGPLDADRRVVKNVFTTTELDPTQTGVGCTQTGGVLPRVIVVSD